MTAISAEIREKLFSVREDSFADFQAKLIPTVVRKNIIGVRTPILRKLAKELVKDEQIADFFHDLPHQYLEENNLHALIIAQMKDFAQVMEYTKSFLPYIDNWATCDIFSPKIFRKHYTEVYEQSLAWLKSEHTYTVRFAIVTLMSNYLDEQFRPEIPYLLAEIHSEEYYINMALAWYYATALVKQYEVTIGILEKQKLPKWVHNKAIQKAIESYRIDQQTKACLRKLKIK